MNCFICNSSLNDSGFSAKDRLVTGEGPFHIFECKECNLGITNPYLNNDELQKFYTNSYYDGYYEHSGKVKTSLLYNLRDKFRVWARKKRYNRKPFDVIPADNKPVLDVGCGDGSLLVHYKNKGNDVCGVDPSRQSIEAIETQGINGVVGTLEDNHDFEADSFGMVTFQHCLEHVHDPQVSLEKAFDLLTPGGTMIIAVPNWNCYHRKIFGSFWCHLDLPRHLQHFSQKSLSKICEKAGFETIETGSESNIISVAYSIHYLLFGTWKPGIKLWLSYGLGILAFPFFRILDRFFEGDCCYIIARKPIV